MTKDLCSDLREVSHDNFPTRHTYFLSSQELNEKPTHFSYYIMFQVVGIETQQKRLVVTQLSMKKVVESQNPSKLEVQAYIYHPLRNPLKQIIQVQPFHLVSISQIVLKCSR